VTYWRAFQHVIWGTKNREPVISDEIADLIERSIRQTCQQLGVKIHMIGFMPDHVHLVCSIPPRHAPSEVMRQIKAFSSRLLNDSGVFQFGRVFYWQPEFGLITLAEGDLARVVHYAANQRDHHAENSIWADFELTDNPR